MNRTFFYVALGTAILGLNSVAQAEPPRATARFCATAPRIDGVLDEAVWETTEALRFGPAESQSEVRFLWNADGVFVSFQTADKTPVFGSFAPGAPRYQEDVFELFIDQTGDHRQFYEIQIDPAGGRYLRNNVATAEPRITGQGRLAQEYVETALWRYDLPEPEGFAVASKLDQATGSWTLELFLPASMVNRRQGGEMKPGQWLINLARLDWEKPFSVPDRKVRYSYWAPVLDGHPHISPTLMGTLKLER